MMLGQRSSCCSCKTVWQQCTQTHLLGLGSHIAARQATGCSLWCNTDTCRDAIRGSDRDKSLPEGPRSGHVGSHGRLTWCTAGCLHVRNPAMMRTDDTPAPAEGEQAQQARAEAKFAAGCCCCCCAALPGNCWDSDTTNTPTRQTRAVDLIHDHACAGGCLLSQQQCGSPQQPSKHAQQGLSNEKRHPERVGRDSPTGMCVCMSL